MILTVGTSLALARTMIFDHVAVGDVNRAKEVLISAAGKSVNVARVAYTLGERVVASGVVGGATGQNLRDDLDGAGIAHDFIESAAPTRVCVTVVDLSAGHSTELIEETAPLFNADIDHLWTKVLELAGEAKVIVGSGSLAPGMPVSFYSMLCRLARDVGAAAIIDASGEALLQCLPQRPWLVKPNRSELAATLKRSIDGDDALRAAMLELISRGAENVAITLGGEGAILTDGTQFWCAAAPRVAVVSPIGSGDAFAAGMAVAKSRSLDLPAALNLAIACGAANAMTPQAGFVSSETVAQLANSVRTVVV